MSWPPLDIQPKPDESTNTNAIIPWGTFAPTGQQHQYPHPGMLPGQLRQWQQLTPQQQDYLKQQFAPQKQTLQQQQIAFVPTPLHGGMHYMQWPYKESAACLANYQQIASGSGSGPAQPAPQTSINIVKLDTCRNEKQTRKKKKKTKKHSRKERAKVTFKLTNLKYEPVKSRSPAKFKSINSQQAFERHDQHKTNAPRRVQEHKNKVEVTAEEVTVPSVLLSHLKEHQVTAFKNKLNKNKFRPKETLMEIKKAASVALHNLQKNIDSMGKPVPEKLKVKQQLHDECAINRDLTTHITLRISKSGVKVPLSKVSKITIAKDSQTLDKSDRKETSKGSASSCS